MCFREPVDAHPPGSGKKPGRRRSGAVLLRRGAIGPSPERGAVPIDCVLERADLFCCQDYHTAWAMQRVRGKICEIFAKRVQEHAMRE